MTVNEVARDVSSVVDPDEKVLFPQWPSRDDQMQFLSAADVEESGELESRARLRLKAKNLTVKPGGSFFIIDNQSGMVNPRDSHSSPPVLRKPAGGLACSKSPHNFLPDSCGEAYPALPES